MNISFDYQLNKLPLFT